MSSIWVKLCCLVTAELFEAVQTTAREPESRWWQDSERKPAETESCVRALRWGCGGVSQVSRWLPPAERHIERKGCQREGEVFECYLRPRGTSLYYLLIHESHFIISAIFIVKVIVLNCWGGDLQRIISFTSGSQVIEQFITLLVPCHCFWLFSCSQAQLLFCLIQ